jgi:RecB family exonuclease
LHRGTLFHDVLAGVYRGLQTDNLLPLSVTALPRANELLRFHVKRGLRRLAAVGTPAERRLIGQEAVGSIGAYLESEALSQTRLIPVRTEWRFGGEAGVDVGGLRLRGRMDRVDGHEDALFVIDYKSGTHADGPAFAAEHALQIPLYILALRALHADRRVIGGAYAALAGDVRAGMVAESDARLLGGWLSKNGVVDEQTFEAELAACLQQARVAADGIARGEIGASAPGGCPRYCDLSPVCRGRLAAHGANEVCSGLYQTAEDATSAGDQLVLPLEGP